MVRICFVCLGNICRSPTAEGIMLDMVAKAGLSDRILVDSAGTSAYHVGERADRRSAATARRFGIELGSRSRQFRVDDFDRFDHVIAMDSANVRALRRLARSESDTARISLLRERDPEGAGLDVPDPYYDGDDGFVRVFRMCERSCRSLLGSIRADNGI